MTVTAIAPAAGSGERLKGDQPKQFLTLGGKPILAHTLEKLSSSPLIDEIILVTPADDVSRCKEEIVEAYGFGKVSHVIEGGATRQESVSRGFGAAPETAGLVLVHDGVRPFVTVKIIENVIQAAESHGAAVAAIPVTDTLKKVKDGVIAESLSRHGAVRIQTPQCFRYGVLGEAIERAERDNYRGADESSLVKRMGLTVRVVPGSETNIKITTPDDMILAEALYSLTRM